MRDKYIIELEDKPFHKKDGDFLYRVKGFNSLVFDMTGISKLTPYTAPDIEQARMEAYQKGYETGYEDGYNEPGKNQQEAYQKGLNDLWEAVQKAIKMYCEIDNEVFLRVFYDVKCDWGESVLQALFKNTPQHLIDSIRQYEQRQEEQIQVGDEVIAASGKAVIIDISDNKDNARYIYSDSTLGFDNICNLRKTGRHFPEVAAVLEKMREGQDE